MRELTLHRKSFSPSSKNECGQGGGKNQVAVLDFPYT